MGVGLATILVFCAAYLFVKITIVDGLTVETSIYLILFLITVAYALYSVYKAKDYILVASILAGIILTIGAFMLSFTQFTGV